MNKKNFKVFYWAPDYSFCGFAPSDQVRQTGMMWMKDKKLKLGARSYRVDKSEDCIKNVSSIPELMEAINHSNLEG